MKKTPLQDAEWESLCRRCGRCCYEKVDYRGEVFYTDVPCEHLDLGTRLCNIYEERTRRRPGCLRLTRKHLARGLLPGDCPYVAGIQNYPAPKLWEEED